MTTPPRCCGSRRCRWASTTPTTRCPGSATACISPSPAPTTCSCSAGPRRRRSGPRSTGRRCAASRRAPSRRSAWPSGPRWTSTPRPTAPAWTGRRRHRSPADHQAAAAGAAPGCRCSSCPARLDSLTPRLDGATLVARQMGPSARLVTLANLTHVTVQDGDNGCAMSIYQRFVRDPGGLPTRTPRARAGSPRSTPSAAIRGGWPTPSRRRPRPGNPAGRQALRRRYRRPGQRGRRDQPLAAAQRRPGPGPARRPGRVLRRNRPEDHSARRAVGARRRHRRHRCLGSVVRLGDRPAHRAPGRRRGGPADRPMASCSARSGSPR